MRESLEDFTPVTIFEEIMSPKIFEHIVKETVRYSAVSKNKSEIVTVEELKTFIGILMFSSYHKLSSTKNYWSNDDDLKIPLVKTAMARNRFQILKSIIHFCDNNDCKKNNEDRGFKVKPLVSMIQEFFIKFGVFEECLAVDKIIVRYYDHNSLKQFIRSKPIGFGYKLWALCGASGYCYNFDLYCGKSVQEGPHEDLVLGSKVVLKMVDVVKTPQSHCLFFDNLFTGYDLLVHLMNIGYRATGTM